MKLYRVGTGGDKTFVLAEDEGALKALLYSDCRYDPSLDDWSEWEVVEYPLDCAYILPESHQRDLEFTDSDE